MLNLSNIIYKHGQTVLIINDIIKTLILFSIVSKQSLSLKPCIILLHLKIFTLVQAEAAGIVKLSPRYFLVKCDAISVADGSCIGM